MQARPRRRPKYHKGGSTAEYADNGQNRSSHKRRKLNTPEDDQSLDRNSPDVGPGIQSSHFTTSNSSSPPSGPPHHEGQNEEREKSTAQKYEETRKILTIYMDKLVYLDPLGPGWMKSNAEAQVGTFILYPHVVACKDRSLIVDDKHDWIPARGGILLAKYRPGFVFARQKGRAMMKPCFTFQGDEGWVKHDDKTVDVVMNETYLKQRDYVHVVADDADSEPVGIEEVLFEKGKQLHCRRMAGFPSTKTCYMSVHETYILEDGAPIQLWGRLSTKEDIELLHRAHAHAEMRTATALQKAEETWVETPRLQTKRPVPGPPRIHGFSNLNTNEVGRSAPQTTTSVTLQQEIGPSSKGGRGLLPDKRGVDIGALDVSLKAHDSSDTMSPVDSSRVSEARKSITPPYESPVSQTSMSMPPPSGHSEIALQGASTDTPARNRGIPMPNTLMNKLGLGTNTTMGDTDDTQGSQSDHQSQSQNPPQPKVRRGELRDMPQLTDTNRSYKGQGRKRYGDNWYEDRRQGGGRTRY